MCDYSLTNVKSRQAKVGDKLITHSFGTGTNGFTDPVASVEDRVAVCVLPGTEIAFSEPVMVSKIDEDYMMVFEKTSHTLARFRQIDKEAASRHHDALEFPDGEVVRLTDLKIGQSAVVLQLPATPKTVEEVEDQRRVEYVG